MLQHNISGDRGFVPNSLKIRKLFQQYVFSSMDYSEPFPTIVVKIFTLMQHLK